MAPGVQRLFLLLAPEIARGWADPVSRLLRHAASKQGVARIRSGRARTAGSSTVEETVAWAGVPARRAAKVSDTEPPVSLMSASTGVRHQVGRLGQCPAAQLRAFGLRGESTQSPVRGGWTTVVL